MNKKKIRQKILIFSILVFIGPFLLIFSGSTSANIAQGDSNCSGCHDTNSAGYTISANATNISVNTSKSFDVTVNGTGNTVAIRIFDSGVGHNSFFTIQPSDGWITDGDAEDDDPDPDEISVDLTFTAPATSGTYTVVIISFDDSGAAPPDYDTVELTVTVGVGGAAPPTTDDDDDDDSSSDEYDIPLPDILTLAGGLAVLSGVCVIIFRKPTNRK